MWVALQLSLPKGEVGAYVRPNAPAYTCASIYLQTVRSFTKSWRSHTETSRGLAVVHASLCVSLHAYPRKLCVTTCVSKASFYFLSLTCKKRKVKFNFMSTVTGDVNQPQ